MNKLPGLPDLDRCAVMGVVNVTPDSFSDGGLWLDPAKAVAHGLALAARGADLVDVGGESTRPGAQRVTEAEELRRVIPVVEELAAAGVAVSVDTMRAAVAERAVAAGARLVNDVSGGLADPEMAGVVAATGAPFVVMHWRGQSADMDALAVYDDVVTDVVAELTERVTALTAAGVKEEQLVLDPGLGFAKTPEHNWALLGRLEALTGLGRPVLVAASRKRFLGTLLANPETGELRPARERDDATAAVSVLSARAGAWAVRVHDVAGTADAVRVVAAWQRAAARGPIRG
ncbi:dihydropteroate synthase [Kitasatospora sp. NPDC096147]|uniref:dihydropteroate synthase n=1 Tax=Kitasatospora sp. NPDC096147 TaxID=3364093 RepID=UPI0037FEBCBC